ncbi:MAG TPA: hypothetical protein VLE72_01940 [Candidatus Saccharimonadales bacterium]|nr:hypothetical protein [Candidatus Saccharimonadales bacterium]
MYQLVAVTPSLGQASPDRSKQSVAAFGLVHEWPNVVALVLEKIGKFRVAGVHYLTPTLAAWEALSSAKSPAIITHPAKMAEATLLTNCTIEPPIENRTKLFYDIRELLSIKEVTVLV